MPSANITSESAASIMKIKALVTLSDIIFNLDLRSLDYSISGNHCGHYTDLLSESDRKNASGGLGRVILNVVP
jgi:hypothetical protein